jgi:hypothetical protein
MLQDELAKRDEWLRAKDDQTMALLHAKDEQLRALLRTKDEQIGVLLSTLSAASGGSPHSSPFAGPSPMLAASPPSVAAATPASEAPQAVTAGTGTSAMATVARRGKRAVSQAHHKGGSHRIQGSPRTDRDGHPPQQTVDALMDWKTRALELAAAQSDAAAASMHPPALLPQLLQPGDARLDAVEAVLECVSRLLPSLARRERKGLSRRVDALLEDVDSDEAAPVWLSSALWTEEQAEAVLIASQMARASENTVPGSDAAAAPAPVASAVKAVLEALENVVASCIDKAEQLLEAIQSGEVEAVMSVLDHSLAVLETLAQSSSRKRRKAIDEMCERVEHTAEHVEAAAAAADRSRSLASCEAAELKVLCEHLQAANALQAQGSGDDAEGCVAVVAGALEVLDRCISQYSQ